ncbi:MAG: hypothetical protein ABIE03_00290 [Patescibacteria group bacterium]|nr:hypothetical protein [Patescibacteria group bacterium]
MAEYETQSGFCLGDVSVTCDGDRVEVRFGGFLQNQLDQSYDGINPPFSVDCVDEMGFKELFTVFHEVPVCREMLARLVGMWMNYLGRGMAEADRRDFNIMKLLGSALENFPLLQVSPSWVSEYLLGIALYEARQIVFEELVNSLSPEAVVLHKQLWSLIEKESEFLEKSAFDDSKEVQGKFRYNFRNVWIWSWSRYDHERRPEHRLCASRGFEVVQDRIIRERGGFEYALALPANSFLESTGLPAVGKTLMKALIGQVEALLGHPSATNDELGTPFYSVRNEVRSRYTGEDWIGRSHPIVENLRRRGQVQDVVLKMQARALQIGQDLEKLMIDLSWEDENRTARFYDSGITASAINYIVFMLGHDIDLLFRMQEFYDQQMAELGYSQLRMASSYDLMRRLEMECSVSDLGRDILEPLMSIILQSGQLHLLAELISPLKVIWFDVPPLLATHRIETDDHEPRKQARLPYTIGNILNRIRFVTLGMSKMLPGTLIRVPCTYQADDGILQNPFLKFAGDNSLVRRLARLRQEDAVQVCDWMPINLIQAHPIQILINTYRALVQSSIGIAYRWDNEDPWRVDPDIFPSEVRREAQYLIEHLGIIAAKYDFLLNKIAWLQDETTGRLEQKVKQMFFQFEKVRG